MAEEGLAEGIVIVGAGHAGSQLAASLHQEGYRGPVTLVGAEADFPYHRPPLSKAFLKSGDDRPQPLRAESFYASEGVTFLPGVSVSDLDLAGRTLHLSDGTTRPYGKLVLATGAHARRLNVEGAELDGVVVMRTIADARAIRARLGDVGRVVVVGGGFVGLETAATLHALGKPVSVLEIASRLLGRAVAPQISDHVLGRLQASGVPVSLGMGLARIEGSNGRVTGVVSATGDTAPADMVLVGIGAEPETALAEAAGILCRNGVLVDGNLRTSDPHVFAIGDCARFDHWQAGRSVRLESVQNATDQARQLARFFAGKEEPPPPVPWFWSDIGDMKLQMAGLSFDADTFVTAGDPSANAFSVYHFRNETLIAVDSVNRAADHMTARRMLAASDFALTPAQAAGGEANSLFKAWQTAAA